MRLHLPVVFCEHKDGVATVGFADDQHNTRQYVLLTRCTRPTEADRQLGMSTPHLEVNSQNNSAYCDVIHAIVGRDGITLQLDGRTSAKVSNGEVIDIDFVADDTVFEKLKNVLLMIVGSDALTVADTHKRLLEGQQ